MSEWGWAPMLIFALGAGLVAGGIIGFVSEMVRKSKAHKRNVRKLSVMQDLKDLNS